MARAPVAMMKHETKMYALGEKIWHKRPARGVMLAPAIWGFMSFAWRIADWGDVRDRWM